MVEVEVENMKVEVVCFSSCRNLPREEIGSHTSESGALHMYLPVHRTLSCARS